jgi:2-C-methyl-D-erythritol 4-phosphate cytidylyltransferase
MKKYAIIVAGGKGLRMGYELPKQFIAVADRPILMRTLNAFYQADNAIELILVLPDEQMAYWKSLCELHAFRVPHRIAPGGSTRFHSVGNGLRLTGDDDALIAIHDGVRPFVSADVIRRAYAEAERSGGAVPVVDMVDSVRQVDAYGESTPVDREALKLVQTPQTFRADLIRAAYRRPYDKRFTDDASVFEAAGYRISLIAGNRENIKITTPFDLLIAEALIE